MKWIAVILLSFVVYSCLKGNNSRVEDFRTGNYKTVLEDEKTVSTAYRNDSLQIETYEGKKDTFYIQWLDAFEYVLVKKNPRTRLDSTDFHVKITGIGKDSYEFKAFYKGSNFEQKGIAYKLEDEE